MCEFVCVYDFACACFCCIVPYVYICACEQHQLASTWILKNARAYACEKHCGPCLLELRRHVSATTSSTKQYHL